MKKNNSNKLNEEMKQRDKLRKEIEVLKKLRNKVGKNADLKRCFDVLDNIDDLCQQMFLKNNFDKSEYEYFTGKENLEKEKCPHDICYLSRMSFGDFFGQILVNSCYKCMKCGEIIEIFDAKEHLEFSENCLILFLGINDEEYGSIYKAEDYMKLYKALVYKYKNEMVAKNVMAQMYEKDNPYNPNDLLEENYIKYGLKRKRKK